MKWPKWTLRPCIVSVYSLFKLIVDGKNFFRRAEKPPASLDMGGFPLVLLIIIKERNIEGVNRMTDKERKDTKMATIYELRLLFTSGEKREYTVEEIAELLDKIAAAKDQE